MIVSDISVHVSGFMSCLQADDTLSLRYADYAGQDFRGHLSHFDVVVRQTIDNDIHDHTYIRDANEVAVEEYNQSWQSIQSDAP